MFRLPWGAWCVRDTELALTVLRDPAFHRGMSTFFGDMLPSRTAQIALGRAVRDLMRAYLPAYRQRMAEAAAGLGPVSQWPGAGPLLVHRCTADVLLRPGAPPALRRRLAQAVAAGLTARQPSMRRRARAELLRPELLATIIEHVHDRRAQGSTADEPQDVLDAVIGAGPEELTDRTVANLYVLLFQSIVGNIGYAVAWSLLLACLHHPPGPPWPWPADWLVREAARHRPFVWMVGRPVPHALEFGGLPFAAGTILSVSPYLLHHDPHRWDRPETFRPGRWGEPGGQGPYLPFSAGPFTCAGAAVAHSMATEAVAALAQDARLTVSGGDARPLVSGSVLPRPFTLRRDLKAPVQPTLTRGGE
ncbi:cytochrome P450 [Streptomyces paromomycinus]|uniref:Cytochrome P450 n=1 Tax=Streptomyces paromomycinus TaxID=92743 RepID=A0A401WE05_STREY|nr:cytochrome P450 [Streptomyces paromomycinus]GCD47557.1 cytochrome P450 [Streptomyces paromomycinus]